jgi:hypothetical protein
MYVIYASLRYDTFCNTLYYVIYDTSCHTSVEFIIISYLVNVQGIKSITKNNSISRIVYFQITSFKKNPNGSK